MDKVSQPHDKFFRASFGKVDFAKDFLNNYLPEELVDIIDMDTLVSQPTTYISKELKEQFADLLYRTNINNERAYISFLFEHKSFPDKLVIFQVLKYMLEIWEAKMENDLSARKKGLIFEEDYIEIPIVIPLVVYHDKDIWRIKRSLGEMMPGFNSLPESIKKYIPDFEYMLTDLGLSDKENSLEEEHSIVIRTLNKARYASKDEILDIFTEMVTIYRKRKDRDMVKHHIIESMVYILSTREDINEEELKEIANKISEEGSDLVMTAADRLMEKGMEKGIEKGIEEGIRKSMQITLFNRFSVSNLELKKKIDQIQDSTILESLLNKAFQVDSLEEFSNFVDNMKV